MALFHFISKEEIGQPLKDDRLANIPSRIPSMYVKLDPNLERLAAFYLSGERRLATSAGILVMFSECDALLVNDIQSFFKTSLLY